MNTRVICTCTLVLAATILASEPVHSTGQRAPDPREADPQALAGPVAEAGDATEADTAPAEDPDAPAMTARVDSPPVYVPPRRGAPQTRVGGGTRSADPASGSGPASQLPRVLLLSPEHTGLTSQAAPGLYWFLSADYQGDVEVVVTARDAVEPLWRHRLHARLQPGIHTVDLAAQGVSLDPGRLYQWSVSLVRDEQHRSRDIVAVATIERIAGASRSTSPEVAELAAAGLWYDAIAAVSRDIAQTPERRLARAALLDQVGLEPAARWDRGL